MTKSALERTVYNGLLKPFLFRLDPETIHNAITLLGENWENAGWLTDFLFSYRNSRLAKRVLGLEFSNPVGLAAGFDYDGHLAKIMSQLGFGFSTVGTVTAKPYAGNKAPRLVRLPQSRSLLVNKGFKSDGAVAVAKRLSRKSLTSEVTGISVGSSNVPSINTVNKAIDDYLWTFNIFKGKPYVKYFELNVSCPNTAMTESFTKPKNFRGLTKAVVALRIKQPIFVKMPNEIEFAESDRLVRFALAAGIQGFIFSNLVKKRDNPDFNKEEIAAVKKFRGNFSGRPTARNAKNLLAHTREKFGKDVALISTGGIFSPRDAWERLSLGADLVQLITGMIYEGPQLAGAINEYLAYQYTGN